MKRICLILAILAGLAFGHAAGLDTDTDFGLYFSQSAYGNDWAGEGLGNISWTGKFYGSAELRVFKWLTYKAVQNCSFGQTHGQYRDESGRLRWAHPEKNADRWDWELMMKIILHKQLADPFLLIRDESMFRGEDDEGNPESPHRIQVLFAVGLSKDIIATPDTKFDLRLSQTFRVKNEVDEVVFHPPWFGGASSSFNLAKWDSGVELDAGYKQKFSKINAMLRSNLRLYQVVDKFPNSMWSVEGWQPLEVNLDTDFTIKLWKCVTANLNFALKYDIEEVDKLQWRQMLGLGVGYFQPLKKDEP